LTCLNFELSAKIGIKQLGNSPDLFINASYFAGKDESVILLIFSAGAE
jgi:hypothetical protein